MWWNDTIYLLDLGMVGEVDAGVRESLLLLLLAFWREDTSFLADAMLGLATEPPPPGFDERAFADELAGRLVAAPSLTERQLRRIVYG
jgi:predicted unusual protein kinase regulating ubiquinone biosynthesis (AarF/ABC1/UbiB family)